MTAALELSDNTGKAFLRISAEAIWVAPGCNVDVVARRFLAALHGQISAVIDYEVAKAIKSGRDEVSIIKQEEKGDGVCAADVCQECGHQWNVG